MATEAWNRIHPGIFLLVCCLVVGPAATAAWTSDRADPRNTGALGPLAPGDGDVLWVEPVGGLSAPPALTEDTVIVAAGAIRAVDVSTGDEEWAYRPTFDNFTLRGWFRSTPVTDGEVVAFSTAYPSIHVAWVENGTELWRDETETIPRSLEIHAGQLFAAFDGNVTKLELTTGGEVWRSGLAARISSLTVAGGTVFAATKSLVPGESRVYALEASTGETIWNASLGSPATGGLAVGADVVVVASAPTDPEGPKVKAFDRGNGEVLWETIIPGAVRHPLALEDGTVFASYGGSSEGEPGGLLALSTAYGDERWSSELASGTIAVAGGVVFAGGDGVVGLSVDEGEKVREFGRPHPAKRVTVGDGVLVATSGKTLYGLGGGHAVEVSEDVPLAPFLAVVVIAVLTARASARRG